MLKKASFIGLCLGFLILLALTVQAQDVNKGWQAFQQGDYATALREWRPLAEQGNADAQYNLGRMYANGYGVAQDYDIAVTWYRKSAEQGNAPAQGSLGNAYYNGEGVIQSYATAVEWYRKSAENGNAQAQGNLGLAYAKGEGVIQNYQTAHVWFNIASANGDEQAAKNRNLAEGHLPPTALLEAQRLAQQCIDSNYQDCP